MSSIQLLEGLIHRLPVIAHEAETVGAFWQRIDDSMTLIRGGVTSDGERAEIEARFEDLVEMANGLGILQKHQSRGTQKGQLPQLSPTMTNPDS